MSRSLKTNRGRKAQSERDLVARIVGAAEHDLDGGGREEATDEL